MSTWEKRITHAGLNAYRLVRGQSREDVELKARLQLAQWEHRWLTKERAQANRRNHYAGKEAALERTLELEQQREALTRILGTAVKERTTLDWESLKPRSPFASAVPPPPKLETVPVPPSPLPHWVSLEPPTRERVSQVLPVWSVSERLVPLLRKKKQAEAEAATRQIEEAAEARYQAKAATRDADIVARNRDEKKFADAQRQYQSRLNHVNQNNEAANAAYQLAVREWQEAKHTFLQEQQELDKQIDNLRSSYFAADASAIKAYIYEILARSLYPDSFPREHLLDLRPNRHLILDFELPNTSALPQIKEVKYVAARSSFQEILVSDAWLKKTYDDVLYQICLRTLWEIFSSDDIDAVRTIVFNGWVRSLDRSTGANVHACVMSLEVGKDEFLAISLEHVDPKACFKKMKGVSASRLVELSPVKPLDSTNREDKRFVEGYGVAETLDDRTNLAAMDWLDFENLIREVFEKEFSKGGGEVKITQASRDGGVDAVAFDPDPIRGGRIVIQAKRYTNTVGVSAVRDLYGTVHNEGANKGILVTTSDFGPDAYEFAKGKNLTLLSGGELLYLLGQHGHTAKIDIAEAKRMAAET